MKTTPVALGGLPKIPDYRIYQWEKVPELSQIQKRLAVHGLKDPWIRNEVWRYHPLVSNRPKLFFGVIFRGFIPGLALAYLTWQYQKHYTMQNPDFYHWQDPSPARWAQKSDHHGHGHDDHAHAHGH